MFDLRQTTFLIPIYFDSPDREENALITLSYLCKHLQTNILIYEYGPVSKVEDILSKMLIYESVYATEKNQETATIELVYEQGDGIFHRTRALNKLLAIVKTPVCVNYDCDILLEPEIYLKCQQAILNGMDLQYPYFAGLSQGQINLNGRRKLKHSLDLTSLDFSDYHVEQSAYGHCQFFNTTSYREGGGENDSFISYGPEDQERFYRFKKLGYKVCYGQDKVFHIEHSRGENSSVTNPYYQQNVALFDKIKAMSTEELKEYYAKDQVAEHQTAQYPVTTEEAHPATPAIITNRHKLIIATVIRDEPVHYVQEWIQYHQSIGVDHFVLYDHLSSTPAKNHFSGQPHITLFECELPVEKKPQLRCFHHTIKNFRDAADWVAFIDVDEFINSFGHHFSDQLSAFQSYGGICLNQLVFGDSFRDRKADLVLPSYTWTNPEPRLFHNRHVKTIVNTKFVSEEMRDEIHNFNYLDNKFSVNPFQERVDGCFAIPNYEGWYLNHYYTKSWEDFAEKVARGRVDTTIKEHQYDWRLYDYIQENFNRVPDLSILTGVKYK